MRNIVYKNARNFYMVIIEDLGVQELTVYDIQTETTNMFFANDILVHNSMYLKMEKFVSMFNTTDPIQITRKLDKLCKELMQPVIEKSFQELAEYVNAFEQAMRMKREAIAEKGIWTGKKHYILNCWDIEGVEFTKPELKIVGIEVVKSSTPQICRKSLKDAIGLIVNESEVNVQKYIKDFKTEFFGKSFEEIAFPRGVKNLRKYADGGSIWGKGCPIHVKGSLIYNHLLKKQGLVGKYPLIEENDKIKFAYMKKGNPYNIPVFAIVDEFPNELGLEKFVDYDTQFEKTFFDPLNNIMKVIGWNAEKINTMEAFFE